MSAEHKQVGAKKFIEVAGVCGDYQSDDIFYSDAKLCVYNFNLSMIGDAAEFNYTKRFSDVKYFTSIYFTDAYPIINKKVTFQVPDFVDVELKEFNFEGFNIQKKKSRNERFGETKTDSMQEAYCFCRGFLSNTFYLSFLLLLYHLVYLDFCILYHFYT